MARNILMSLLVLAASVIAQKRDGQVKPPRANSPPEVATTVEAIQRSWTGPMIARVPWHFPDADGIDKTSEGQIG